MANTLRIKRRLSTSQLGAGAPAGMAEGELAVNFVDSRFYIKGDLATPLEFADKAYVDTAITTATGNLGTMSTQNADTVAITGGTITGAAITGLPEPIDSGDAATKNYVDGKVSDLGSVFRFIGDTSAATGNDLATLSDQSTGSYYRVDVAGTYTFGSDSFALKVGDAIVKTSTGWQKLDNVDVEVLGYAEEISVDGNEETGYTVRLADEFKTRVTDVESKTQNIDLAGTTAGVTQINGEAIIGTRLSLSGYDVNYTGGGVGLGQNPAGSSFIRVEDSGDTTFSADTSGIILGSQYGSGASPSTLSIQCRHNLVGVDDPLNNAKMTIENFIIDGGEF